MKKRADGAEVAKRARDYTPEDEAELDTLVKSVLGEQASGKYLGVRVAGVKGDEAFYGHAVIVTDPSSIDHDARVIHWDRLEGVAKEISSRIPIAGNVTIDLESFLKPAGTHLPPAGSI